MTEKTNLTDSEINERFVSQINNVRNERNIEFFAFSKQILLLSTTLITLMIGFRKFAPNTQHDFLLSLSIGAFGLNILLALIVLHGKIRNHDKMIEALDNARKLELVERLNKPIKTFVPFDIGVVYAAKILYVSFAFSVLSLCLYGISYLQQSKSDQTKTECPKR